MTWARRCGSALLSVVAVLLLGTSAWAAPTPAPGAPAGAGVTSWTCSLRATPVPTLVPSPTTDPTGSPTTVPSPSTTPVPDGQDCAATSYGPPLPTLLPVHEVSPAPVDLACGASDTSTPSATPSASPTTEPGPSSSPSATGAEGCTVHLASTQYLVWSLFGGLALMLAFVTFVRRETVGLTQ